MLILKSSQKNIITTTTRIAEPIIKETTSNSPILAKNNSNNHKPNMKINNNIRGKKKKRTPTNRNFDQPKLGRKMKRGIPPIVEIGAREHRRMGFKDPFNEREVVEVDGAAEAEDGIDHILSVSLSICFFFPGEREKGGVCWWGFTEVFFSLGSD